MKAQQLFFNQSASNALCMRHLAVCCKARKSVHRPLSFGLHRGRCFGRPLRKQL